MKPLHRLLGHALAWLMLVGPLHVLSASPGAYPACATACIGTAVKGGLCLPTDKECVCHDATFQTNVTTCVMMSCTIPESLVTKNITNTNCGVPVRDRSGELVLVSNTLIAISFIFLALRFAQKIFFLGSELGLDDWCILATALATIPSACITAYGTAPNGLGKDIWTLEPDQITSAVFWFYMMAWLYFLQTMLIKLSFVSFFLKIFPARDVQRLLWGTFGVITAWGVTFILTTLFQCRPIHYFWTKWDGVHEGSCASANSITWSHASMSIALDLWILAIPLWQLRSLQLHWKKKVGVALMLCVGTFVTIVSCIRLQSLVHFASTSNSTWEFFDVTLWSTIEITVGVMCANLPQIRMLLVKAIPALGGSSQRSKPTSYGGRYGTSGAHHSHSKIGGTGGGTRVNTYNVPDGDDSASGDGDSGRAGITYQKSYVVQFSEQHDEASLVHMTDLKTPNNVWQVGK